MPGSNEYVLQPAPEPLLSLIEKKSNARPPEQSRLIARATDSNGAYGMTALEAECAELASTPESQRNDKLNRASFALGQLFEGGELSDEKLIEEKLSEAAIAAGLEPSEISRTFRSGFNAGRLQPRSAPELKVLPASDNVGNLPRIAVRHELQEVTAEAEAALAQHDGGIFVRAGALVHVARDAARKIPWLKRSPNTPTIETVSIDHLRSRMDASAHWVKYTKNGKTGEVTESNALPPIWAARALHAQGTWCFPPLEGVVEVPVLRADGSIVDKPGYDADSGLMYLPSCDFPPVGATHDEAVAAAEELLAVVKDFPFHQPEHRAAWLAGVLSPMARWTFSGPAPLVLIDANSAGTGKGLLVHITGIISIGRSMAVMPCARDEEMRKRITAIALSGDRLALIDNVTGLLGGPALDAMLTATTWRDRLLGTNKMAPDLPLYTIWFATGNNVELIGDTARRTLHVRLESPLEEPESRTDFEHSNLRAWVIEHRSRLTRAGLTMLRAYMVAGRPGEKNLPAWGSYEEWSGIVRGAIVWAGLPDPYETRTELVSQSDVGKATLGKLLDGVLGIDPAREGISLGSMVRRIEADPEKHGALREALSELGYKPNCDLRGLGRRLAGYRGRVVKGMALDRQEAKSGEGVLWLVARKDQGDVRPAPGSGSP